MNQETMRIRFGGRLLLLGFGSIGKTLLPMLHRHVQLDCAPLTILAADDSNRCIAARYGASFLRVELTPANLPSVLDEHLRSGDCLLNVSVNVSSLALIEHCSRRGILYVDTSIEPWPGACNDASLALAERTNYHMRETVLELKRRIGAGPTAVVDHGANPGLVSHFTKRALCDIASSAGAAATVPRSRHEWAELARDLRVRLIQVSERDTQASTQAKRPGEFVNTWSIEGFTSEAVQPAEVGWGSHEKHRPSDARWHEEGCRSAIYLNRPGAATRVRSWAPAAGPFHALLISHDEAISMADFFAVRHGERVVYRPTVHYAYHPSDDALLSVHEFAGRNWELQPAERLLEDDIVRGMDELGVLVGGASRGAYWFGSQLSIDAARALVPYGNATTVQVAAGALAALIWAIENSDRGIVEPDELDFERCLEVARPYLGRLVGEFTEWTPLTDRHGLFPEAVDVSDPWQFANLRVSEHGFMPMAGRSSGDVPLTVGAAGKRLPTPGALTRPQRAVEAGVDQEVAPTLSGAARHKKSRS